MNVTFFKLSDKHSQHYGPWLDEPDKAHFISPEGLHCLILRSGIGHLCGYVAVPKNHAYFGKNYDEVEVKIHGGLTYSGANGEPEPEEAYSINWPGAGEDWWFGFDCGHSGDYCPAMGKLTGQETYRDFFYVVKETLDLATQLAAIPKILTWQEQAARWHEAQAEAVKEYGAVVQASYHTRLAARLREYKDV